MSTNSNTLSLDDLLRGGDVPTRPVELPHIQKDGKTGRVWLRPCAAGLVIAFADTTEAERNNYVMKMVASCVCTQGGQRLFEGEEQVLRIKEVDIQTFNILMKEVMRDAGLAADSDNRLDKDAPTGNAPVAPEKTGASESASAASTPTPGVDSPTASLST